MSLPRIVIFGLDGGTIDVIRPLLAAGRLPVLGRLMAEGSHGTLQSTLPPITPTGWTSFMTGKYPRSHGLYDFLRFVPGSYATQAVSAGAHGHHTLWRIVSEWGMRVIALDVPFTYPPEPVNGCLIAGYGVPTSDGTIFTYPAELRAELQQAIGACDPAVMEELPSPRPELFREWDRILANRERMSRYLMARDDWQLFMLVFGVIDNIQHALWNYLDPLHPNHYASGGAHFRERIYSYYEQVDAMMGRLLAEVGPRCHVVVMSDHGFGSTRPGLFMSSFLVENGWLR